MNWVLMILIYPVVITVAAIGASEQKVKVPEQIESYLQEEYPEWRRYVGQLLDGFLSRYPDCDRNQIAGDFNGDGFQDFAILLTREKDASREGRLIALLGQKGGGFLGIELRDCFNYPELYLCLIRKGAPNPYLLGEETLKAQSPTDGISLEIAERASSCIFIDEDGEVQSYPCGD